MKIKTFNTGRAYTADGQKISYTILESGFLVFWDHARHVEGAMRWNNARLASDTAAQHMILAQYDSPNFWDVTCDCMQAIGRADYYSTRDALRTVQA